MIRKLWIVGDSFGFAPYHDLNENIWSIQLAKKLKCESSNLSGLGTCQDWIMNEINFNKAEITNDDQIVVILTDPARFWFYQDNPWLTNVNIIYFDKIINDQERAKAAEYYIRYIQRPELDTIMLTHQLGWLNNLVSVKNWRKVLIIKGFDMYIPDVHDYTNLDFSVGTLYGVSTGEINKEFENYGVDPRFNHMCLSNHTILTEKIINYMLTGETLDLTSGFIKNIISTKMLDDTDFVKTELSTAYMEQYNEVPKKIVPSWKDRFLK